MNTAQSFLLCKLLVLVATGYSFVSVQEKVSEAVLDQRYAAAIKKAENERAKSLERARNEFVEGLEKVLVAETKKGNLDSAIAIREKLRFLGAHGSPKGNLLVLLRGTNWVNSNGIEFKWEKDGSFLHAGTPRSCSLVSDDAVAIFFDVGHVDVLQFNAERTSFEQYSCRSEESPLFTGQRVGTK